MTEPHDPQRIEIELTSHDPAPRSARTGAVASTTEGTDAMDGDPADAPDQRLGGRLGVVIAGVAVTALLIGIVVGRMGGAPADDLSNGTVVDAAAPTTTAASAAPIDADGTLPAAEPLPATTRPTPTTTRPGAPATSQVAVDPAVSADGVEVVALTNRGQIVRLDLATGTTVSVEVDDAPFGPPALTAGDGWILLPSFDPGSRSVVLFDDGTRSTLPLGSSWPVMTDSSAGRIWVGNDPVPAGLPDRLVEMTIDGRPTGVEVELRGFAPRTLDPLGGVVVDAPGGSYVLRPDSSTRLTTGRVLAIGTRRVLVHECDRRLECAYVVIDRSSGARTTLALDPELASASNLEASAWWAFENPWNPSEDAVLVVAWDQSGAGRQSYGVLDLDDGGYTELGTSLDVPAVRWIDDHTLLRLERGRLEWLDLTTGESVLVAEELPTLSTFTTRPLPSG